MQMSVRPSVRRSVRYRFEKSVLIQSIFKLEAPNFAWQFIFTLRNLFAKKPKWPPKNQMATKNKMASKI